MTEEENYIIQFMQNKRSEYEQEYMPASWRGNSFEFWDLVTRIYYAKGDYRQFMLSLNRIEDVITSMAQKKIVELHKVEFGNHPDNAIMLVRLVDEYRLL